MSRQLVECIPNFSEARRPEVVEKILSAISSVAGIQVLDYHSDLDQNRTVVTFVGTPQDVESAALKAVSVAAELIDLGQHQGSHPRIGAADVIPLVPLENVSMEECITMTQRMGEKIGQELGLPVYLYECSASSEERRNLEFHRQGEYEGLQQEILGNPSRQPDYGPSRLGPAGAVILGARQHLITLNVFLNSNELSIARRIARSVQGSTGGLRNVKAMGFLAENHAQVSMSLTNYQLTPLPRILELVRSEAARFGVSIHHTEIQGLVPQEALLESASWYLQLERFHPEQILERRLATTDYSNESPAWMKAAGTVLDNLRSSHPTPGGGAAAALTGASAAALTEMVLRTSLPRQKQPSNREKLENILHAVEEARSALLNLAEEDSRAYDDFIIAMRTKALNRERAALRITLSPMSTARLCTHLAGLMESTAELGNPNALADMAVAASLVRACIHACQINIQANLPLLNRCSEAAQIELDLNQALVEFNRYYLSMGAILEERGKVRLST